jgi:hypothetical protein
MSSAPGVAEVAKLWLLSPVDHAPNSGEFGYGEFGYGEFAPGVAEEPNFGIHSQRTISRSPPIPGRLRRNLGQILGFGHHGKLDFRTAGC